MDLRLTDLAEKKLRAATGKLLVDLNDTARAAGLDKSTMESLKRRLKGATERHKEAARIAVRPTQPPAATVWQNSSYR
jgi:hypothetical protein